MKGVGRSGTSCGGSTPAPISLSWSVNDNISSRICGGPGPVGTEGEEVEVVVCEGETEVETDDDCDEVILTDPDRH